jgi:hypothetical protein
MSVVVKNVGAAELTATGQVNTSKTKALHGNAGSTTSGTVRVVLRGVEYVWGPNESKTLPNDIGSEAVAASNSRLRIADSRDGWASGGGTART